jgi:beta-glucosidase
VEGGLTKNQWAEWESATRHDGKPACVDKSGDACKHWEAFESDVDHMAHLGLNMYRFSIEWSRIEPEEGVYDDAALDRYRHWCEVLRARGMTVSLLLIMFGISLTDAQGIEPMVTLHHFTEPTWFHAKGGFETDWGVEQFAGYAIFLFSFLLFLSDTVKVTRTVWLLHWGPLCATTSPSTSPWSTRWLDGWMGSSRPASATSL